MESHAPSLQEALNALSGTERLALSKFTLGVLQRCAVMLRSASREYERITSYQVINQVRIFLEQDLTKQLTQSQDYVVDAIVFRMFQSCTIQEMSDRFKLLLARWLDENTTAQLAAVLNRFVVTERQFDNYGLLEVAQQVAFPFPQNEKEILYGLLPKLKPLETV